MTPFEIIVLICVLTPGAIALVWLYDEHQRAERAWDTIAEMRLHLDVFFFNQRQINSILLDEIGVELSHNKLNANGAVEYYISGFKPPHPEAPKED